MLKPASLCTLSALALALVAVVAPGNAFATALINLNMAVVHESEVLAQGASTEREDISTREELDAYAEAMMASDPLIQDVDLTDESVKVAYREKGQFLALIPVTFDILVEARADGEVTTKYPWYSVVTVDKQDEIEAQVKIAVRNALNAGMVGSVRAGGEYEPRFTASESAEVAAQIHAVLQEALGPRG
jgi:hypothetical protein